MTKKKHSKNKKVKNEIENEIKSFWNEYAINTRSLSNICRKIAFGEGAVCWIFKYTNGQLPPEIKFILYLLVLFFLSDALQYSITALFYWSYAKYYEYKNDRNQLKKKEDVFKSKWINYPSKQFLIIKIGYLSLSTYFLVKRQLALPVTTTSVAD